MTTRPLAPALGRLAAPPSPAEFDDLRLALLDALVRIDGVDAIDEEWPRAWQEAMAAIRDRVIDGATAELEAAGRRSRYPGSRLAGALPDAQARERLLNRLLAEGIPVERLAGGPVDAEGIRRRGAALELAWDGAVAVAGGEAARWRALATRVAEWRRPWRPLIIAGAVVTSLGVAVALVLGGYLPAPAWFRGIVDRFWEVPWP